MILSKIIGWISGNEQRIEEMNESTIEKPEAENNRNIDADDGFLSPPSSSDEAVLDSTPPPLNSSFDSVPRAFEADKSIHANINRDSSVTVGEVAPNCLQNDCNPNESEEMFPDEDSQAGEVRAIDNQTCDIDGINEGKEAFPNNDSQTTVIMPVEDQASGVDRDRRTGCFDSVAKSSPSYISPLSKKISDIEFRSFCTQAADKQGNSTVIKYSHKNNVPQKLNHRRQKTRSFPAAGATRSNNHPSFSVKEISGDAAESVVYGALYVVGCNKAVPEHLVDKMNAKYVLRKRRKANGVREAFSYVRSNEEGINAAQHVISYRLSNNRSVVFVYKHDSLSDMFQIGRYEEPALDFRVVDMNPPEEARNGVSRFACRILVHRDGIHEARVHAAAFDSSQTIFMGNSAIPSSQSGKMDGFTTNGVLIMHPGKENGPGVWREVSVSGYIYPARSSKTEPKKRSRILEESNVLQDGTMIDLCGVTLLWRTPEGLKEAPSEEFLSRLQSTLQRSVPDFDLLMQPSNSRASEADWTARKAYVYISCGHVVGLTLSKLPENPQRWPCPVCRVVGPLVELKIGAEPGFCVDREFPSHAFKPCGHAASLETVEYWASTQIPNHRRIQGSHCPFCGVKLNFINQYVELILPVEQK